MMFKVQMRLVTQIPPPEVLPTQFFNKKIDIKHSAEHEEKVVTQKSGRHITLQVAVWWIIFGKT